MTKIKLSSGSTTPISRTARPLDEEKTLNESSSSSIEISALPDAVELSGGDLIPLVQVVGGKKETRKTKAEELEKFLPPGPPGQDGAQGEAGPKGEKGDKGDKGDIGPAGPAGKDGAVGSRGEKGEKGDVGPQGEKGDAGPQGEIGPQGPKGDPGEGGNVTISPVKDNLLKQESDGLKVLASHPIIPKIYSTSYTTTKSAMARQSMPDGAVVYRGTFSVKNPLGISRLNNIGIFTSFSQQSGCFYLGKDNEFVTVQVHAMPKTTTASTITADLALVFSAEPYRAFDVYSGEEQVSPEEGDAKISVSIRLVAGTTMGQNGFD
ncbi:collagen-like protein [Serratia marcescens]|uniref:collagen-like protein n=1 Tax=Serratia marcescens TaxID=615 RepID=UPI0004455EAB|nr:collagen-like protein [Serratia marcescens]EIM8479588.1 collagen-like protein [Serratia marcescens]EIU9508486.1 collagen-like protein [Serratia marcescens]ETX38717.1 hypothetical protein P805_04580 [Serratia marcescens BIDMC 44]MBH2619451.1 collagen-like protein [Serratia marcescens]MBI6196282.1 collagen-like protein [Serratia marcescens]